jgi:threonine 3-dehydrogenase
MPQRNAGKSRWFKGSSRPDLGVIRLIFSRAKDDKAVVKAKAELGLWLEEVPIPEVRGDDVHIRVPKTSICGTDVHIYNWDAWAQKTIPVPLTIGHALSALSMTMSGWKAAQKQSRRKNFPTFSCR